VLAGCLGEGNGGNGQGGTENEGNGESDQGETEKKSDGVPQTATTAATKSSDDQIVIGSLHAIAPPLTDAAKQERRGMKMAISQINEAGGINGRPVKGVYDNTNADPKTAVEKATRLVSVKGADMIWGGSLQPSAIGISEYTTKQGIPYFTPTSLNALSRSKCKKSTFLMNADEIMRANALLPVMIKQSGTKGWFHAYDFVWAEDMEKSMRKVMKQMDVDVELLNVTKSELGATDFSNNISQIASSDADWSYLGISGGGLVAFLKQAQQYGLNENLDLYGPSMGQPARESAGDVMIGFTGHARFTPLYDSEENRQFVDNFMTEYGNLPNQFAKDAWESVNLYKKAAEEAGTTKFDPVVEALESVEIEGPMGPLSMRSCDHRCVRPIHVGEVVQDDQYNQPVAKIIRSVDGRETMAPCEDMGCTF